MLNDEAARSERGGNVTAPVLTKEFWRKLGQGPRRRYLDRSTSHGESYRCYIDMIAT